MTTRDDTTLSGSGSCRFVSHRKAIEFLSFGGRTLSHRIVLSIASDFGSADSITVAMCVCSITISTQALYHNTDSFARSRLLLFVSSPIHSPRNRLLSIRLLVATHSIAYCKLESIKVNCQLVFINNKSH